MERRINLEIYFLNCPLYNFIKKVEVNNMNNNAIPSFLISVSVTKKQKANR